MSKLLKVAAVCAAVMTCGAAWSATATANFQVTATVQPSCSVSGSNMNFGSSIDPLATTTPLDATSTLTLTCTNTTPYQISLNAGTHAGGATNFSSRAISNGTQTIGYQLYTDSGRTSVWGNGTASSRVPGTGTGSTQSLNIYGRLPSLAGAVPGNYSDTVTVTIDY